MLWYYSHPNNNSKCENFEELGRHLHVKIDCDGNIVYQKFQSPSQDGELGCTQVPCPKWIPDNRTCWSCCGYH